MTCTVTGASGSCPVTGLADSTDYTFTATATNASSTDPSLPSAASDKAQFVTVSGTPTTAVFGTQTPISLTTTGGSSGAVTFTVTGTGCTVTGTSLTATRAGTCTVTATQGAHKSTAAFPFTAPASHTVTFQLNGGKWATGSMSNQVGNQTKALSANNFSWPGRTFSGWATTPMGSVEYTNNYRYEFTADANLYAIWVCRPWTLTIDLHNRRSDEVSVHYQIRNPDESYAPANEADFTGFIASTTAGGQSNANTNQRYQTSGDIVLKNLRRHTGYSVIVTGRNKADCEYTSAPVHVDKFD